MKHSSSFLKLGALVYASRLPILLCWLLFIIGCIPFLPHIIDPFKTIGFVDETSKSVKADEFLNKELGYGDQKILIIYHSKDLKANQPAFIKKIKDSLVSLDKFPIKNEIIYPDSKQISKDKHSAYVVILFKTSEKLNQKNIKKLKQLIKKPPKMTMKLGGEPFFVEEVNKQTQKDLFKADLIAAPISLVILILIFRSVVAALLSLIIGGGGAVLILTSLYFIGHGITLSVFTLNIALLLGLCLTLDYSLFIISRFRDEMEQSNSIAKIMAVTMHTSGKAVFFSGLVVFLSLSALLFFPVNMLFSLGIGGMVAVFMAVINSVIVLPAILCLLINKINLLPVLLFKNKNGFSTWRWLAQKVVEHPFIYFLLTLMLLLLLGYPFLKVKFGISDTHILPKHSESRNFLDEYKNKFNEHELTPIVLIVKSSKEQILSSKSLEKIYDFADKLKAKKSISQVNSIVTTNNKMTKQQYYGLYKHEKNNKSIKQLLNTTTGKQFTTISVVSKHAANDPQTKILINQLEKMKPGNNLTLEVTGTPVNHAQVFQCLANLFPYALIWILVLTYLLLLVLLKSLFLPLKAILMNIVSLSASYGLLVYIFQEGHFHHFLNFEPQGIMDTSLLIIIFCALFGFSMDYEVFLLTRIKEYYDKTKDNNESIIFGIDKSSRIITSAAIIVIVLCGAFMVADVLVVKEFGLGIAVAIFVDAFLVRSILVPSTMTLVKKWNWYLPKWLGKILSNYGNH